MDAVLTAIQEFRQSCSEELRQMRDELRQLRRLVENGEKASALRERKSFTVPEAAHYAGVESSTVRRWLADGKLKGAKKGGQKQSRWRIRRQDLDAFLERVNNSPG